MSSSVASAFYAVLMFALSSRTSAQLVPDTSTSARIVQAARAEAQKQTPYIMDYEVLKYPGGDVSSGTGVCTDLVVRAFRAAGLDLQHAVHQDICANRSAYPRIWDKTAPDRNIDHRRCPNLAVWFRRHAQTLTTQLTPESLQNDWQPGDVVFFVKKSASHPWHTAIISDKRASDGIPYLIDSFPPHTSESHRLDDFLPIQSFPMAGCCNKVTYRVGLVHWFPANIAKTL